MKSKIFYFLTGIAMCFSLSDNLWASSSDREPLLSAMPQPIPPVIAVGAQYLVPAERAVAERYQTDVPPINIVTIRRELQPWVKAGLGPFRVEARSRFRIERDLSNRLFDQYSELLAAQQRQTTAPAASAAATTSRPADRPRGRLSPQDYAEPDQLAPHAAAAVPSLAPAAPEAAASLVRELESDSRASSGRGSDISSPPLTPGASDSRRSSDPPLTQLQVSGVEPQGSQPSRLSDIASASPARAESGVVSASAAERVTTAVRGWEEERGSEQGVAAAGGGRPSTAAVVTNGRRAAASGGGALTAESGLRQRRVVGVVSGVVE